MRHPHFESRHRPWHFCLVSFFMVLLAFTTAVSAADTTTMRTWKSTKGTAIEAQFVKMAQGIVYLKKADGTTVPAPYSGLSNEDQAFARANAPTGSEYAYSAAASTEAPPPRFLPTPKSVTVEKGIMMLTPGSRIVYTDQRLQPLATILSDEILLQTDMKLTAVAGGAKPGDIVLKINPEIRAGSDIWAAQRKAAETQPVRSWKSKTGTVIEASFAKMFGGQVSLFKPATSNNVVVPLSALCDEDQALIRTFGTPGREMAKIVRTKDMAHTIEVADMATVEGWDYRATAEGTVTLLQAIAAKDGKYYVPRMKIKDWPYADYTSTMVDCARKRMPLEVLKMAVQGCRLAKLRYLHLHLTDDHGCALYSKAFPELGNSNQGFGGGDVVRSYSWDEMKALEAYAVARGIGIVPEIDTPGHFGAMQRSRNDIFGGPGCMNMASEKLYDGLEKLIDEQCAIFKSAPYFHIGGDECNVNLVGDQPQDKIYMKNHPFPGSKEPLNGPHQIYQMHTIRLAAMLKKHGKLAVVWEGFGDSDFVKDDVVVMCWMNGGYGAALESRGFAIINTPWEAPPMSVFSLFTCNGHNFGPGSKVLGSCTPLWQISEYSLTIGGVAACISHRVERTWGPDNPIPDEAAHRKLISEKNQWSRQLSMPVDIVVTNAPGKGNEAKGCNNWEQMWYHFSGTISVKLVPPFPKRGEVHYTLDGSDPTIKSPLYKSALTIKDTVTLKAALFYDKKQIGSGNSRHFVR